MIEYTLLNVLILELKVFCGPDKFYGRSKFGQYDTDKNRAPSLKYESCCKKRMYISYCTKKGPKMIYTDYLSIVDNNAQMITMQSLLKLIQDYF